MAVRAIILDVDGTLTDGTILYNEDGTTSAKFHVKDGQGIVNAMKRGVAVVFCTGRNSAYARHRAKELGVEQCYVGVKDKKTLIRDLADKMQISCNDMAYIGDDLNDLEAMRICGFRAAPADASSEILAVCNYRSRHDAGHGAVRDIIDHLLGI